jgi:hypothetical protein
MSLTANELIELAPEFAKLAKIVNEALQKDPDGKVRVTKAEGAEIKAIVLKLVKDLALQSID